MSLKGGEETFLLAVGKAAGSMARAMLEILPGRRLSGVAVLPRGTGRLPPPIRTLLGSHPVPNANSFRAGSFLLRSMSQARAGRDVIHLISGGASALAAAPLSGRISRSEKALLHRLLISSGLGIRELNVVRGHHSGIKGGRLAARGPGATQLTLLLSDVPEDCPESVGGGPTLPDPSTWQECVEILASSGILGELPAALRRRLQRPG